MLATTTSQANGHSPRRQRRAILALLTPAAVLAAFAGGTGALHAQPAGRELQILFSDQANDPNPTRTNLRLRPNTAQSFFLYVRNNGTKATTATLELRAGGSVVPGSRAELKLQPGLTSVSLPKPPPPPAGGKPTPPSPLPAPLTVRLLGANNTVLDEQEILVARATDYVRVARIEFDPEAKDGKRNRLTVEVEALPNFSGPKCRVEIVLPDGIKGLVPGQKKEGTYGRDLTRAGEKVRLVAENIRFTDETDHRGYVYLTIDGVERAFIFDTTFVSKGATRPDRIDRTTIVRLDAPAAAIPSDKTRVGLEIDNLPIAAVAELGLYRDDFDAEGKKIEVRDGELRLFRVDRHEEIVLGPPGADGAPDGAIQFKSLVRDWNLEFDTTGVYGKRKLRLRVLGKDKKDIDFRDAKTDDTVNEIVESLILDGSRPEGVRFVKPPLSATRGKPLTLTASGSDPESGIREVVFYLGKPVDDKMPPGVPKVDARPDAKRTTWTGTFSLPADKVGTIDVTAQFTNGVGLVTQSAPIAIDLVEPEKPGTPTKASIAGTVVEGPRPQAGLTVTLLDLKGGEPVETKTNDKGEFLFTGLNPGKYRVSAAKSASRTRGEQPVQVKEGEKKTGVTIKLFRKG